MSRMLTLPAHFDGADIRLDEPYALEPDTKLLVTILPKASQADEMDGWLVVSANRLTDAYGQDEPEYTAEQQIKKNPDYDRR